MVNGEDPDKVSPEVWDDDEVPRWIDQDLVRMRGFLTDGIRTFRCDGEGEILKSTDGAVIADGECAQSISRARTRESSVFISVLSQGQTYYSATAKARCLSSLP